MQENAMSEKERFLQDLGELLVRYPDFKDAFTVNRRRFEIRGMESAPEAQRCCEWGKIPGDGYVCLKWCD